MMDAPSAEALQQVVDTYFWWHSIKLTDDVATKGGKSFDIMDAEIENAFSRLDVRGRSVLDVGAWNGGFLLEAWRRGASSVTGLDHFTWNHPYFRGRETFDLVSQVTGANFSAIDRDLDQARLDLSDIGQFDIVLFLGVFYHLKDPIAALREVSSVTKDVLVLETHIEPFSPDRPAMMFYPGSELGGDPTNWWGPNSLCVIELLKLAGFQKVELTADLPHGRRQVFHAYK